MNFKCPDFFLKITLYKEIGYGPFKGNKFTKIITKEVQMMNLLDKDLKTTVLLDKYFKTTF